MKKKILFLIPLPPPVYGAAISSKLCLGSTVLNRRFEIMSVRLNYSETLRDIGKLTTKKFFGFFVVWLRILKSLVFYKPDLVYFTIAPLGLGFLRDSFFVLLCKAFRKRILFHLRGKGIKDELRNPLKRFWYKLVFKNMKVIIINEQLYTDIAELMDKTDIFVLPNAIKNEISGAELGKIVSRRRKKAIPDILFLSNMDVTKGPMIVLKACRILKDQGLKFRCNFVGAWVDDKLRKNFESYVKKHNLGSIVNYLGAKIGKGKSKILGRSDILAFPTYYRLETFGLVVLEAMEYGIPVVANAVASIPFTIAHGRTGFLLKKNTPQELANYLKLLITNRSKAVAMGLAGRKRFLKNYCFPEYERKLVAIFECLL